MQNEQILKEQIINYIQCLSDEVKKEDLETSQLKDLIALFFAMADIKDEMLRNYFLYSTQEDIFDSNFKFTPSFVEKMILNGTLDVRNIYIYFEELRKSTSTELELYTGFADSSKETINEHKKDYQESEAYNDLQYENKIVSQLETTQKSINKIIEKLFTISNKPKNR